MNTEALRGRIPSAVDEGLQSVAKAEIDEQDNLEATLPIWLVSC